MFPSVNNVLSNNPGSVHRAIRGFKSQASSKIHSLVVGDKVYQGAEVPDGFYDSLSSLKAPDMTPIHSSPEYQDTLADFENVLKICRSGNKIPDISTKQSTEILLSLKKDVNDLFSITASHFINAGISGYEHFHFLMAALIANVNLASLDELNNVWACILHGKDKESDRSYRTISTCPILAKALDVYVGQLFSSNWAGVQAGTQFQGAGSSHDLAALLLTETVQHSIFFNKKPAFVLLLDAKSAFDKVIRECVIRNAYLSGSQDHGLLYLNSRLEHRKTFVEWDKVLMGPIHDLLGVEQGGVNSDRLYKLCNNVQLDTAQLSNLGISVGSATISSIGQADDTALVSDSLSKLAGLLHLAEEYCRKYHVDLVPEKTKLLAFAPNQECLDLYLHKLTNPLSLQGHNISFSTSAEHVGILRSCDGNMPHILSRMPAHNRGHRGNPAAGLHLDRLYGCPVLLSGLAAMILIDSELANIHHHHKVNLERVQRLHSRTPECVVYFLAGSLPASALLHLRMFSLLGMIARLGPNHILNCYGRDILLSKDSAPAGKSLFLTLRFLTQKYSLPDPLLTLQSAPTKNQWKRLTKARVIDWWEVQLRGEAAILPSLTYFNPSFMSLSSKHQSGLMQEVLLKSPRQSFLPECFPADTGLTDLFATGPMTMKLVSAASAKVKLGPLSICCSIVQLCPKQDPVPQASGLLS